MSDTTPPMIETDLPSLIRETLEQAGGPQTLSYLAGKVSKDALSLPRKARKADAEAALDQKLDEMVRAGQLYRLQPTAKTSKPCFFPEPADFLARKAFRQVIETRGPISATEAKKAPELKPVKKFLSSAQQDRILKDLVQDGAIYEWPKQGKKITKVRYSLQPADPREYLEPTLEKFRKDLKALAGKLEPSGIRLEDLLLASRMALSSSDVPPLPPKPPIPIPPPEDLSDLILELMQELEPAALNGAAVPIAGLRHEMEFQNLDKDAFDNEILRLAQREILDLHRYDHPASLSQIQRDDLVPDGQGGYFIAVARRV